MAVSQVRSTPRHKYRRLNLSPVRLIRWLIWIYFVLLLSEGALRKWFLSGFSAPLLIVRDPIAIAIIGLAFASGNFPKNRYLLSLFALAGLSVVFSFLAESVRPFTILFGLRTNFLHLPLIFIIGKVFRFEDVAKLGLWLLILALPMSYLIIDQFSSAPTDRVNTGVGGTGAQIRSAAGSGKVRASGTFSFVNGVVYYLAFAAAFTSYGLLRRGSFPAWILYSSACCIAISLATSGSRGAIASVIMVLGAFVILFAARPRVFGRIFASMVLSFVVIALVSQIPVVKEGVRVMEMRFEEATSAEGSAVEGFVERTIRNLMAPITHSQSAPLFGYGLGAGTNAGSALSGGGAFALGEDEWHRVVLESGPIAGNLFILWRILLTLALLRASYIAASKGNYLPALIWGAAGPLLLWGQIGQPTTLGFVSLGGGLVIAALNGGSAVSNQPRRTGKSHRVRSPLLPLGIGGRVQ